MIQDLSGSWCIKGASESTLVMDSPVPLIHHDPDRSWITDSDPVTPKERSLTKYNLVNLFVIEFWKMTLLRAGFRMAMKRFLCFH